MKDTMLLAILEASIRTEKIACELLPGKNKQARDRQAGSVSTCKLLLETLERFRGYTEEQLKEVIKNGQPYGRYKGIKID